MPITNYAHPPKMYPFDINDVGGLGTAFEIAYQGSVLRRGIVIAPITPNEAVWLYKVSALRASGQTQDLRGLFDNIADSRLKDCELRAISMGVESFANWIRAVPRPVRDLAGHVSVRTGTTSTNVLQLRAKPNGNATKRERDNSLDHDVEGDLDWEDEPPMLTRILNLEAQVEFLMKVVKDLNKSTSF